VFLGSRGSRWRCLLVWLLADAGLAATIALTLPPALVGWRAAGSGGVDRVPLDAAVVSLAATTVVLCAVWGWLAGSAEVLAAARGRARCTGAGPCRLPDGVRRTVLAACGVALTGGVAAPAVADVHLAGHHHSRRAQHGVSGLPLPERVATPPHRARDGAAPARGARRVVVVASGDSLWSIAAADLSPDAGAARISDRWHAVYAANRVVVGPDPDRILPGQHLLLPGKER
jgi:hypothetical protein